MPWKIAPYCNVTGCKNRQPCTKHKREYKRVDNRPNATQRGYGDSDWQRCRKQVLKRDDFKCAHCGNRANVVHHEPEITGPDDPDRANPARCISLCRPCHERRHGR
jgi:5-methylcytosine-specific restriction endonuclease McrA